MEYSPFFFFPINWVFVSSSGIRFSNLYCDPQIIPGGHKITARQRWQPTPMQLQILENIFDQGNGTPSKQRIKEITAELSHHGQISETNVYNWFQNRRARSKRKQAASLPNNAESEAEVDEESLTDKKPKSDRSLQDNKAMGAHNADRISGMHHLDTDHDQIGGMMYGCNDNGLRSSGSSGQMSFYGNIMPNPSIFSATSAITSLGNVKFRKSVTKSLAWCWFVQESIISRGRWRAPGASPISNTGKALTCLDDMMRR